MEGEGKIVCRQMAPAAVTRHPGPRQPVATDPFLQTVTTGALILMQSYFVALAKHLSSLKIEKPHNSAKLDATDIFAITGAQWKHFLKFALFSCNLK